LWQDAIVHTTSVSLLNRLRRPNEQDAWTRFVKLYSPLLYAWAHRLGLADADAADLVQDVFTLLVQKLPEFQYDPQSSFRNWLRTITLNKWRDRNRRRVPAARDPGDAAFAELAAAPNGDTFDEVEYRQFLANRALQLMQNEFSPRTWKACWEHVVAGRPAAEVAAEMGIAVGSVYVAKSRVISRLREELQGLME
jgi:RNA polymerase sigma-70 factor (ECF subfamily)